ncbi:nestin [Anomaloglossus baeobatrachus]|uniref:nestin n=1 Tax=Anomaloglossus baeobatrachus TaxID=238106 RepID=UPI003F4F8E02
MSRMETYPTSIALGEESTQMWSLNKRLEAYLSRVKVLEEENNLLRAEIHHLKSTRSDKSFIRKYHDEIMMLRDALDDGHREMVQVETDRDSIYQEIEYVKELCHQEKQAQEDVKKELSESKRLLEEEKRAQIWLKDRLFQLEQEMEDIFNAHEEEKALMEKEISSYSQRLENFKIAPVNFKPVNVEDYANQLSQIWQGAVEEYKNKVSSLEENLTQAKENLKKVLDENKQSQLQLQNLDGDLESLKNRKEMLEGLLTKEWLEQQDEEGRLQLEIETLEKEKEDLRIQIAQVLEDRQQLMHLKMFLSLEVATYRSLLEAESTRLYSPSMDYKMSSSFSDLQLEQNAFRKSHHGNTKQMISRDTRLNANKKQNAETPSTKHYLNVKSTSTAHRTSPVTKEFQKVSSVLQSQGLKYTKASSAKTATTLPPVESNLRRHPKKENLAKKNPVETITTSAKSVTEEILKKDTNIQPVVNAKTNNTSAKELKKIEHTGEYLPLSEKEIVSNQVEYSSKTEGKHIIVNSDFVFEKQHNVLDAPNKDDDTLVENPNEKIGFEASLSPVEVFGNIKEEHIKEKQKILGQTVTCQQLYVEKEEIVEPLVDDNIETPIKVNHEEFRKVLDFSKSNLKDLYETNVPTSDGIPDAVIEYSHSQMLEFDSQVDKEIINHVVDEEKESLQLKKDFDLEEFSSVDRHDEDMTVVQNFQVLTSSKEEKSLLSDDGQSFTKNIDELKSEIEQYNVHHEKDTEEVSQNTKIQEYENEIDQQYSSQADESLEADPSNDEKQENTQFNLETQEKFQVCESINHLSNDEDFREQNKKEGKEDYVEDYTCEENIMNAEEIIHDSINIKQSRILVVKDVYQSSNQVMDEMKETQLQSQKEKNNFELSDLEILQQKTEIMGAPEEITQDFSDINQEESEDQKDNVQNEINQLSENSLQLGLENLKTVSDTRESPLENKQVVRTLDSEKGDSLLESQPDSKQEELYEIVHKETVISKNVEDIQQIEQCSLQPLSVQSTPEHELQSSESEGLERDHQSLENNQIEDGDINTSLDILNNSEFKIGEEDDKDVCEENYVVCTAVGFTKAIKTEVCVGEDYTILEEVQEIMTQESQLLKNETNVILDEVAGNELEHESSFHKEIEEIQMGFPQKVEKGKKGYHQDVEEENKTYHQEVDESQECYYQEIKGQEGQHQKTEVVQEGILQKVKEGQEQYHHEVTEIQESYHQELKGQENYQTNEEEHEGDKQEVEDQVGCEVTSTFVEHISSEEDSYIFQKDSEEEQFVGFSLNIIPNNLRFSSENAAEVQVEETETRKDENNDLEVESETSSIILEEKEKKKYIFETEIIVQQSTLVLEHECENVIEESESHMVLAKNLTEKYAFDVSSEKQLAELDEMEATGDLDYENSKSEYSMDSQDISICSQKSEELEISKEYQLEQTLPDTTPLPNLDEFEDLALDEVITASEASAEVTDSQSHDGGEAEDMLDSNLESQLSQILSKVSEQSVFFKDDGKDPAYTEKQGENPKELCENENPEHAAEPELDTEDSSAALDTINSSVESSEDLVESKMDDGKSEFEEPTMSQEEVEASKDHLLEKKQYETTSSEDQVQLSSKQLFSESVNKDHSEEPEERRQIPSEDTNAENILPETFVLSSEHSETALILDPSHEDAKETEEHSDLVTQDFGLAQKQTIETEDHEIEICKKDTISLPNLDDEPESFEDVEIILASEQSREVTESHSPVNGGEIEEGLDRSLESQSSQIFPEESEQSNVMKEDGNDFDYHDQEAKSPKGLLENENLEYFVEPNVDTENCYAALETEKPSAEDKLDSTITYEAFETEEFTTSQEEVSVVSSEVENFETNRDSQLEDTQIETSSQNQVISAEQLLNKSIEEDCNDETEEKVKTLSEDVIAETVFTATLDLAPLSEHSETELVYALGYTDTKENEEHITKDHSDQVAQDFVLERVKNIYFEANARDFCKEDTTPSSNFNDESENLSDDEIILATETAADGGEADSILGSQSPQKIPEVSEQSILVKDENKDSDYHKQGESVTDLLESNNPEQVEEPKLETQSCSETPERKGSSPDLSGDLVDSNVDDENSEESTISQEKEDIFSVNVDEFEESNVSQLRNTQFETTSSEDQVQLSSEQLVSESVDEDHNGEHEEKRLPFSEDTENVLTKTLDFVPSSAHSESELVLNPRLEDTKEAEEYLMKEHSDVFRQDLDTKQTQSENTEEYERDFCKEDTIPLPNLDDESKSLENNEILASEPSAEVTKSLSPKNGDEADEMLDSSLESQSSQILPEVSEQSIILKDDETDSDYNVRQGERSEDLLESENAKNLVQPRMDKGDSFATLETEKPFAEQFECPIEIKIDDEMSESEESTTSQEEVAVLSSKIDELEASNDSKLKKKQLETTTSENQEELSSTQVSKSVDEHDNEEPEERGINVSEDANTETVLTEKLDFIPSSELSDTELFPALCLEDTKEKEEIMKEHFDFVTQDFKAKQTENVDMGDHEGDFDDELDNLESNEILVSNYIEQQGESPKDLLESENPEHFVEPKLDAEDYSVTPDTKYPSADLSGDLVDSKIDEEKSESEETTPSREEVAVFSPNDEFEVRKDSDLEKTQLESTSSEDQEEQLSEQLVSESVDEDHNEEPEVKRLTLCEDTNRENLLTETYDFLPSSEQEETKFVLASCLEDTNKKVEHIMKEHVDFVTQDPIPEQTESMNIKDHERDIYKNATSFSNPDDEIENLESNEILTSEQLAEVIKLQSPNDNSENEDVLDSSLESQSSQILEVSKQSILLKDCDRDSDYNEQEGDNNKDLLETVNPENVVEAKLVTEDSSAILDTEKPSAELSEDPVDSKMENERSKSEETTTSQEQLAVFSPKIDEFEERKDSKLEKIQLETSSVDQVHLSSEQLVSQNADKDHNEKLEVSGETLCEGDVVTEISSEHSEVELVPAPCLEDTKYREEHLIKEYSDCVTQDFKSNEAESVNTIDQEGNFSKEDTMPLPDLDEEFEILETDEILAERSAEVTQLQSRANAAEAEEVLDSSLESQSLQIFPEVSEQSILVKDDDKDSDYKEQQGDTPKDLLDSENLNHFEEAKLDAEDSSVTLNTEKPSDELSEDPVESIKDDEKYEKPTTPQEQVAVFSPKVDEFEGSKDCLLEPAQVETSSENQVQISSEQLVSNSVDKDHKEKPEEILCEDTNTENILSKTLDFVLSSGQSETELVPAPCHEDTKHSELDTQDFGQNQVESIDGKDHKGDFCNDNTIPLSKFDDKSENLKENDTILTSEQSADVIKLQSSTDNSDCEAILDNSLESQSSQILSDVSEQSILFKDEDIVSDYNGQKGKSPTDLPEGENPEQFVELVTEESSAMLETEEPTAELSEYSEDSKIFDEEKIEFEEATTFKEEIEFSPKVDEFEESKDKELENKHFETKSAEDQVQQFSEQPVSENIGEDHNEEPEERKLMLSDGTNTENKLTEILDFQPSSEHSETALAPALGHKVIKKEEEHKEHCDLVKMEQIETVKTEDYEEFFKEDAIQLPNFGDASKHLEDEQILFSSEQSAEVTKSQSPDDGEVMEVLDSSLESQVLPEVSEPSTLNKDDDIVSDYDEQQGESPKDLPESENTAQFVEPNLEVKDSAARLDAKEPCAELSEHPVKSKMDDEKYESEEPTTSQEENAIVSHKVDEFEGSINSQLEKNQTETSHPEDQVQLSSEQMVSESLDEDNEEESKIKHLTLDEDTNTEIVLIVPSSAHSKTKLVRYPSLEDTTENEDYIKKEHSNLVKQVFKLEQTINIFTEDHDKDVYEEDDREYDVDLIKDSIKEPFIKSLDETNEENIITSNESHIAKVESDGHHEMKLGTNEENVKVNVKPSGESSENDESVTSDESSPNVSTISCVLEQENSSDTDSKISNQAEQIDPLLTPKPVLEGSFMEQTEPHTSSDEEKDIIAEGSDSSFDSNKEHDNISEFTRDYIEDGKSMNGIFGHTIVEATLDLEDHMFYGHSTKEDCEIIISEAKSVVRLDSDVNPQSQDKIEDSIIEFTTLERKSEGLFQSLFETSEDKESRLDEAFEIKNKTDSAAEQSQYTNKLINPYISETDLDDPSKITSSVMDECLVNTKQEVNEANQCLKISQQEDSWSSDE